MHDLAVSTNPFDWDAITGRRRRNLPHIVQPGVIYFLTFRLADSIPQERIAAWHGEYERWLAANPPPHAPDQQREARKLGIWRIEQFLDNGHGACVLQSPATQDIAESTLLHCDGSDYWLGDYVIMPNHLHVLVRLGDRFSLADAAGPWRSVSAHKINRLLRRRGRLWQDEPFDHIVRNARQLARIRRYIQNNPAKLRPGAARLGCGSLFTRDTPHRGTPAPGAASRPAPTPPFHTEIEDPHSPQLT